MPGSKNWRFCVLDLHVFVNGDAEDLQAVQRYLSASAFEGILVRLFIHELWNINLYFFFLLQIGPFDRHGLQIT